MFSAGLLEPKIWPLLLCAVIGYLLGNIQTAIIVSRLYYHEDVRRYGSGNAGSTNMVRVFGYRPGAVTFAGDFLKAVIGILLGRLVCGQVGGYASGLFVVIGHCWPAFASFRGGKGVAASCGAAFMTFPLGAVVSLAIAALLMILRRRVSLMSLTGISLFFLSVLLFRHADTPLVVTTACITAIIYIRHIDNIKRLLRGEEQKLSRVGRVEAAKPKGRKRKDV